MPALNKHFEDKWNILLSLFLDNDDVFSSDVLNSKNEVQRMKFIHGAAVIRDTFRDWIETLDVHNNISEEKSNALRISGNQFFKNNNNRRAVDLYTEAIFKAPEKSKALPLAHANRAAVLFKFELYEEAIDDCESAITLGYPKNNVEKVILRKATCAVYLKNRQKVEECITELEELKSTKIDSIREDLKNIPETTNDKVPDYKLPDKKQRLLRAHGKGRFVVADEPIAFNEPILTEKAFAFIPAYESFEVDQVDPDCHNCGDEDVIAFPCYSCRHVTYCSPKCREQHKPVHEFECKGYLKYLFHHVGIAHLAFRTLLTGFESLIDHFLLKHEESVTPIDLWKDIITVKPKDLKYFQILNLYSNLDKIDRKDVLRYSLTASMLTCYLRSNTKFFENFKKKTKPLMESQNDWEVLFASLLTRHINQMILNAHVISGIKLGKVAKFEDESYVAAMKKVNYFAAIYPRISLYNHSCKPSFHNFFEKTELSLIAIREIQKGAEIFNCYGEHFRMKDQRSRKKALWEQYGFKCVCEPCVDPADKNFLKFHIYACCHDGCLREFIPRRDEIYWWEGGDNEGPTCTHCGKIVDCGWHIFQLIANNDDLQKSARYKILLEMFVDSEKYLPRSNRLKHEMAIMLISTYIKDYKDIGYDDKINLKVMDVAVWYFNSIELEFTYMDDDFFKASVFVLYIIFFRIVEVQDLPGYMVEVVQKIKTYLIFFPSKKKKFLRDLFSKIEHSVK